MMGKEWPVGLVEEREENNIMTGEQLKQCSRFVKKASGASFAVGLVTSGQFKLQRILLLNIQRKMIFEIAMILGKDLDREQVADVLWYLLITRITGVNALLAEAPVIYEDLGFNGTTCRNYTYRLGEAVIKAFENPETDKLDYYRLGNSMNLNMNPYPVDN